MGKGDKPRNCFSNEFRDNYDDINWGSSERDLVNDCPTPFRWGMQTPDDWDEQLEIKKGMIRQSTNNPIASHEVTLPPDWKDCDEDSCANE